MAQTQTLAARKAQAKEEFTQFAELLAQDRPIDVEAAIRTCVVIGKSIDDLESAASARRQDIADEIEYKAKTDPSLVAACKKSIETADRKAAKIREEIAKFDPELKSALDEAAAARSELNRLNAQSQEVSSRLAHVRLGKTRSEMRADRIKREQYLCDPSTKLSIGGGAQTSRAM